MHNVEYFTYDENIKRDWVQRELDHYVSCETYQEGGHGLGQNIRWLESLGVCENYDEAEQCIKDHDRKWYDQLAVRYYEPAKGFSDKKLEELKAKTSSLLDNYHAKDCVWANGLKSEYTRCKKCGSKIKREYIKTNRCPVCSADLRPETTLKAVQAAKERWEKAWKAVDEYINKHAKKTVKWLVKIEYHT